MTFEETAVAAARVANEAVWFSMNQYAQGTAMDEDDITPLLLGVLASRLTGTIGGLTWSSNVLRHRGGIAAEEKKYGADVFIHVDLESNTNSYSKGVLVQAKRGEKWSSLSKTGHEQLVSQCNAMLNISSSAFVFTYAKGEMRCASATKIAGGKSRNLYNECSWTSYRFFGNFSAAR